MKTLVPILVLALLSGCAGLQTNTAVTTELNVNANAAAALLPQAQAGTLSSADCLSAIVSVGSTANDLHGWLTLSPWSYLGGKGLWVTDPNYYSPLCEIMANALASRDLAIGRWAGTPPPVAYLNQVAAQSLKALVVIQGMQADKTTATVSLKHPALKRTAKLSKAQLDLLGIIESKLPPAFKTWYSGLPATTQALIGNDLALVVGWGESQLQAWWNAWESGDSVAARELALSGADDATVLGAFGAANSAGVVAVQTHVAGEVAAINAVKDVLVAIIPAILSLLGL